MGSFTYNCAISGLPVGAGDDVMFLLLTKHQSYRDHAVYMTDWWYPRTFPLKAKYDDYGSVENVQIGPMKDLWMKGFQLDLIEKGVGDNSCHDVAIFKNSTFDQMLEALGEYRIEVSRSFNPQRPVSDENAPENFDTAYPSMRRVMDAMRFCGFEVVGDYSPSANNSFYVDEEFFGSVRVRLSSYGDMEHHVTALRYVQAALGNQWATMITTGSGHYSNPAELILRPLPDNTQRVRLYRQDQRQDYSKPEKVYPCMIRQDVWNALLTVSVQMGYNSDPAWTLDSYRNMVKKDWESLLPMFCRLRELKAASLTSTKEDMDKLRVIWKLEDEIDLERSNSRELAITSYLKDSNLPYSVNWTTNWQMMLTQHLETPFEDSVIEEWLELVAQTLMIKLVLETIRYWWRPSNSVGSQIGEWDCHKKVHKVTGKVITGHKNRWC